MLKRRLVGVITVLNNLAVQSFGYRKYLPLGKPEYLAENLDRWGIDEIVVLSINRTKEDMGPDFDLVKRIGNLGLSTPIIYGGGIRCLDEAVKIIKLGADRICLDNMLHGRNKTIKSIAEALGTQAVIGAIPLSESDNRLLHLNYITEQNEELDLNKLTYLSEEYIS